MAPPSSFSYSSSIAPRISHIPARLSDTTKEAIVQHKLVSSPLRTEVHIVQSIIERLGTRDRITQPFPATNTFNLYAGLSSLHRVPSNLNYQQEKTSGGLP